MKPPKSMTAVIGVFIIVSLISIVNAAFSTEVLITGNAYLRVDAEIRVTNLIATNIESNAYETYTSEYSKDSTSMYVSLPNINSTITYEVTITNKGNIMYDISNIIIETDSNSSIKYEIIGIEKGTEIPASSTHTFTIKILYATTSLPSDITENLSIKYEFTEHIHPYVVATYDYTGNIENFVAPHNGIYKLEVWGAQGGSVQGTTNDEVYHEYRGGYGGYAVGNISLNSNENLFIAVGSQGEWGTPEYVRNGGYNGGGTAYLFDGEDIKPTNRYLAAGGGATHIATSNRGLLANYESYKSEVVIVAGGGGGAYLHTTVNYYADGGDAGGYLGSDGTNGPRGGHYGTGGSQNSPGASYGAEEYGIGGFGQGGSVTTEAHGSAGGAGYYGGGASYGKISIANSSGGGGSSYIGNSLLTDKHMTCYNCQTSSDINTKTNTTNDVSEEAQSDYAKIGNGYAKITFIKQIYS